jgi:hypothetical protein
MILTASPKFKAFWSFAAVVVARTSRNAEFLLGNGHRLLVFAYLNHRPHLKTKFLGDS